MVNKVGVDINQIIKYPHLSGVFQFICGLGPRKSKFVLENLRKKIGNVRLRMQLWADKLIGKNVYINSIGFIKVHGNEDEEDVLDRTRIHPENYILAKKIAKDALDVEKDDNEQCIAQIMDEPEKLDDLDLEDYAEHLAQVKQKPNMITLLKFIVNELNQPFKDPRKINQEMTDEDLFYKLIKESSMTFKQSQLVNCRVIRVN